MLLSYLLNQQVEISIARCQNHDVHVGRVFDNIEGDAHVPIAFGRPIAAANEGFQLRLEPNAAQDVLKRLLFFVVAVDRERNRLYDLPVESNFRPELAVIEMTGETLPRRV